MTRTIFFLVSTALASLGLSAQTVFAQSAAGSYLAARQAEADYDFLTAADYYLDATFFDPEYLPSQRGAIRSLLASGDIVLAAELAHSQLTSGEAQTPTLLAALTEDALAGDYARIVEVLQTEDRPAVGLADGLVLAWAYLGIGDTEAALALFTDLASNRRIEVFASYHKALALAWLGDFEAANQTFSDNVMVGIQTRHSVKARAEILSQINRNDDAVKLLTSAFSQEPGPDIQTLLDKLDQGQTLPFETVADPTEGIAEVFFTIADALGADHVDVSALYYARVAQALRPDHGETLLLTADILERLDRPELAREVYQQVAPGSFGYLVAARGVADTLRSAGDVDGAIRALEELLAEYPDDPMVHVSLGDTFRTKKNYAAAEKAYSTAIDLMAGNHSQLWYTYYVRGISNERLKNWPRAEADFRQSLDLRPGQPQVLNYLGYSLVERREKLDEALKMIEQAVSVRPDSGYIVDSLGWVYYRLGRFDEAVAPMEMAVELMATDPIVNDHLGDVYWMVGREYEARFQWRRALSFGPEEAEADRIRRKLEVGLDVVLEEEADD